jgi:hypothetical protein
MVKMELGILLNKALSINFSNEKQHMKEVVTWNHSDGSFSVGLFWGTLLSVPLWISILGWLKIVITYL